MTEVQQVSIQSECYHYRGLLYAVRPWVWGRPCRRCRRMMDRSVIVVPTSSGAAAIAVNANLGRRRRAPIVVTTTVPQVVMAVPEPTQTALDWQSSQEACPSVLPPKYSQLVAAN